MNLNAHTAQNLLYLLVVIAGILALARRKWLSGFVTIGFAVVAAFMERVRYGADQALRPLKEARADEFFVAVEANEYSYLPVENAWKLVKSLTDATMTAQLIMVIIALVIAGVMIIRNVNQHKRNEFAWYGAFLVAACAVLQLAGLLNIFSEYQGFISGFTPMTALRIASGIMITGSSIAGGWALYSLGCLALAARQDQNPASAARPSK